MKKVLLRIFVTVYLIVVCSTLHGQIISTVAGGATGHGGYWGEGGLATNAQIGIFGGLAVDKYGNIYVVDGTPRVYKVDAVTGIIHTVAGTGVAGYNGDNIQATTAQLTDPGLITVDNAGNFYIADNNYRIRRVDVATGIITTFAGNGVLGYNGDNGPATASDFDLGSFTFDVFGNMILTTKDYRIRKIDPSGTITTIAGTGIPGNSGDGGQATIATMNPNGYGICTDKFGNIYFSDSSLCVRKINISTGIITRVAGTGDHVGYPYSGDNGPATNAHVSIAAIAVDDTGNLYLADEPNARIEKVDTFGIIHSMVGTGVNGYGGDGGPASAAKINYPENVALDRCNNLYIADFNNARVRKVTFNPTCNPDGLGVKPLTPEGELTMTVYPNPVHDEVTIAANGKIKTITISNLLGQEVATFDYSGGGVEQATVNVGTLPYGVYIIRVTDNVGTQKIMKIIKQ